MFIRLIFILYVVLSIGILNSSCERSKPSVEIAYHASNGKVKSIRTFKNDSIEEGTSKYFYENGQVMDSIEYIQNKKNGWKWHFNEKGNLISKMHFENDRQNGEAYFFYENSKIESKSFWVNGKQYGNSIYYYKDGKLKLYNCIDFFDNNIYVLAFDSTGQKIQEEGKVFSKNLKTNFDDGKQVKVTDSIIVQLTVAEPPGNKAKVKTFFYDIKAVPISTDMQVINNSCKMKYKADKAGLYYFCVVGYLTDELTNSTVKKDSVCYEINISN